MLLTRYPGAIFQGPVQVEYGLWLTKLGKILIVHTDSLLKDKWEKCNPNQWRLKSMNSQKLAYKQFSTMFNGKILTRKSFQIERWTSILTNYKNSFIQKFI